MVHIKLGAKMMIRRIKLVFEWIQHRLQQIDEHDRNAMFWIVSFGIVTSVSAAIFALGNPIKDAFFPHLINISKYVAINIILLLAITYVLSAIFSFVYLRIPRIAFTSFIYTIAVHITILSVESSGKLFSYIAGALYSVVIAGILYLILLFIKYKRRVTVSVIVVLLLGASFFGVKKFDSNQRSGELQSEVPGNLIGNPAEKGNFTYQFYTYGSGQDIQREWFGEKVDEVTKSVDSSHFITKWGEKREKFWGFTEKNLPINGRVWLPDGEGTFPIVLMVHGNHTMEYLSTSGYDYLGEQLASHGFIAISVDEDFINFSNISNIPNRNYELRAWVMMQHLATLQRMNESPSSFLYGKIDFDKVGLMGHSRGGQAVGMVADYERFFSDFGDDELLESMKNITIKGIVAIAPTDKSINSKRPHLRDVSFLLIHGARDADVNDFSNERHFYRTSFHPLDSGFKASVYIEKANHTQFNSDWGRMDLSLPRGLFLNKRDLLKPEEQQEIAKLYMTAFFEKVFNDNEKMDYVFENHYHVQDYLPDTVLVTKYYPASYRVLESFAQENSYKDAEGFSKIERVTPEHRRGSKRQRDALLLKWERTAKIPVNLLNANLSNKDRIVFTMANADEEGKELPEVNIEFHLANGDIQEIPLSSMMPVPPVIKTNFTHFGLFDSIFRGDRYKNDWEPVFQTFIVPIEITEQIERAVIHFSAEQGAMMLQEVGVY